mgnify:FL=1
MPGSGTPKTETSKKTRSASASSKDQPDVISKSKISQMETNKKLDKIMEILTEQQTNFSKEFREFREKLSSISTTMTMVQKDLEAVHTEIAEMREHQLDHDLKLDTLERKVATIECDNRCLSSNIAEEIRIYTKRKNLILFHDRSESDTGLLTKDILHECGYEGPKPVTEKVGANPSPLRMTFPTVKHRDSALKGTKLLKGKEAFTKCFIKPDLTYHQRLQQKKCIEELKNLKTANPGKQYIIKNFRVLEKE